MSSAPKRRFQPSLFLVAASLLGVGAMIFGCSPEPDSSSGVSLKIPWPASDGTYHVQEVPVKTLKDLRHLQGDAADIRVDAEISETGFEGPLPLFQYFQLNVGQKLVLVPEDALSTEIAALYAHTEYLRNFDEAAGLAGVLTYPRKIALMDRATVSDSHGLVENNAMYIGASDATTVVRYTLDDTPISLNAGILAHEHFHALFQSLVLDPLGKVSQGSLRDDPAPFALPLEMSVQGLTDPEAIELYNTILLRGINEGFADVWGWLYTNQPDFIYRSLNHQMVDAPVSRAMNTPLQRLPLSTDGLAFEVQRKLPLYKNPKKRGQALLELTRLSYMEGALYARVAFALAHAELGLESDQALSSEQRAQTAQEFVSVVKDLRDQLITLQTTKKPLMATVPLILMTKHFQNLQPTRSEKNPGCDVINHVLPPLTPDEIATVKSICPDQQPPR